MGLLHLQNRNLEKQKLKVESILVFRWLPHPLSNVHFDVESLWESNKQVWPQRACFAFWFAAHLLWPCSQHRTRHGQEGLSQKTTMLPFTLHPKSLCKSPPFSLLDNIQNNSHGFCSYSPFRESGLLIFHTIKYNISFSTFTAIPLYSCCPTSFDVIFK